MKVSLIQMNSISDKAANIAAAEALIERAVAEESPDWVLLPEQFDWAGGARAEKLAAAERLPGGPAYEMARGQAIKHRIFVHAGSIMEKIDGEDRYHNTSVVFNREGEEIARYRKIHLFDVDDARRNGLQGERDGQGGRPGRHLRLRRASRSAARSATTCGFPTSSRR